MPLITGFQSTDRVKAFVLGSVANVLMIVVALTIHDRFDRFEDTKTKDEVKRKKFSWAGLFFTIAGTFCASMISYVILYLIFGFGGGMISN
jgi:hypothetical protein